MEFNDENILRSVIRNIRKFSNPGMYFNEPLWLAVSDFCGVGSDSGKELCRRFGMDPHEKMFREEAEK